MKKWLLDVLERLEICWRILTRRHYIVLSYSPDSYFVNENGELGHKNISGYYTDPGSGKILIPGEDGIELGTIISIVVSRMVENIDSNKLTE